MIKKGYVQMVLTVLVIVAVLIPWLALAQQEVRGGGVQIAEPSVPPKTDGAVAERDFWAELRAAGEKCFREVVARVPLYTFKERQHERRLHGQWLEHGSEIFRELLQARSMILVKQEQVAMLEDTLLQEGLSGVEAYFKIREDIAVLQATGKAAQMKLLGFSLACNKKVKGTRGVARGRVSRTR